MGVAHSALHEELGDQLRDSGLEPQPGSRLSIFEARYFFATMKFKP